MKIGLDIMGGDYAPKATVLGAIEAYKVLSGHTLVLIGDKDAAVSILRENNFSPDNFEFVHTTLPSLAYYISEVKGTFAGA